jgi:CheY-like chemotaxis protein
MDWGREKPLDGKKIGLVYQRQLTKELAVSSLKSAGAGQIISGGAPEMVKRLVEFQPAFIIVEYDMEPLDGGLFLQYIHKNPQLAELPCLMLVHERDSVAADKARRAGAREIVKVPFSVDGVVKAAIKIVNPTQEASRAALLFR